MNVKLRKVNQIKLHKYVFIIGMLIFPLSQFAVFYVYMNFSNMLLAFQGLNSDYSRYWAGFRNFWLVFNGVDSELIFISLKNNLIMFFLTWFIGMPLNILFGYYLFRKKFGHSFVRVIYMLPSMVSGIVMALLFMRFTEDALPIAFREYFGIEKFPNLLRSNSTAFGVQVFYSLWLGFASSIIIYSNAMFAINPSIIEAGEIDGTGCWTELFYLVIPMIMPTLSTYIITGTAGIFTSSGSLFVFYGYNDVPKSTYLMGFYLFRTAMVGDLNSYPVAAATSLFLTSITIPITLFARYVLDRVDPMNDVEQKKKIFGRRAHETV
ncbi:MAG: sugar ABC transporter permease [Clostridia bacterium]|nr:sugar ABC transporter permease [Clostridia bacterium]